VQLLRSTALILTVILVPAGCGGDLSDGGDGGRTGSEEAVSKARGSVDSPPAADEAKPKGGPRKQGVATDAGRRQVEEPAKKVGTREVERKLPPAVQALQEEVERRQAQMSRPLDREELEKIAARARARAERLTPHPGQSAEDVVRELEKAQAEGLP
jgi:hypothetical protein